jgi:hypothetical protein
LFKVGLIVPSFWLTASPASVLGAWFKHSRLIVPGI